mmetsp:Transcript_12327/g.34173  ORF Transcript_12327/g.34173 Transcript_12327/m.34173 type:complete len:293 (-) Transcript_12327:181-1059(-)
MSISICISARDAAFSSMALVACSASMTAIRFSSSKCVILLSSSSRSRRRSLLSFSNCADRCSKAEFKDSSFSFLVLDSCNSCMSRLSTTAGSFGRLGEEDASTGVGAVLSPPACWLTDKRARSKLVSKSAKRSMWVGRVASLSTFWLSRSTSRVASCSRFLVVSSSILASRCALEDRPKSDLSFPILSLRPSWSVSKTLRQFLSCCEGKRPSCTICSSDVKAWSTVGIFGPPFLEGGAALAGDGALAAGCGVACGVGCGADSSGAVVAAAAGAASASVVGSVVAVIVLLVCC